MWLYLGAMSAVFLGLYDICKKRSLKDNAVLPVLFFATLSGAAVMLPILLGSVFLPEKFSGTMFYVEPIDLKTHAMILLKSVIVAASWICAYFALKHLPISIATPIRASAPMWTLLGAVLIFGERPNFWQWVGLIAIIISYYAFSLCGLREGIVFTRNRWVGLTVLATLIGTCSGLYDKFLIATVKLSPVTVQAWFSVYLVLVLGLILIAFWLPKRKQYTPFRFQPSIIMIGVLLIAADFLYFRALSQEGALLSLLSAVRRSSVVVSFAAGSLMFGEINLRRKAVALCGVMASVFLIMFA